MAYGWFSPVKGSYPGLGQEDKTAQLIAGTTLSDICRGLILELAEDSDGNAVFKIANASSKPQVCFISLQPGDDRQAEYAGATWYDAGKMPVSGVAAAKAAGINPKVVPFKNGPAVTGLAVTMSGEYETSVFEDDTYAIGDGVKVSANGKLAKGTLGTDACIGVVTAAPYKRWCNDGPVTGNPNRQGSMQLVLRFKTGA